MRATVISLVIIIAALLLLLFSRTAQPAGSLPPGCQRYMETAVRTAQEADGQVEMKGASEGPAARRLAWATESLAWSEVYRNCKDR